MPAQCLIGELVTVKHQPMSWSPRHEDKSPCIVISANQANPDQMNPGCNLKNSKYPWVYYVLTNSGKILGPLFAAELNVVSTVRAG